MLRASASSIRYTPLLGAPQQDAAFHISLPSASLLEIDGVKMLLDCGWNDSFDVAVLDDLAPHLADVDVVLLSNPTLQFCGALPFVLERIPRTASVISAGSTHKIGLQNMLFAFMARFPNEHVYETATGRFRLSIDSIYGAFRSVKEPYGGKVVVEGKATGPAQVVALDALPIFTGRMLGGHAWLFRYQIDEIFYCPDFSLRSSTVMKRFMPPVSTNLLFLDCASFRPGSHVSAKKFDEHVDSVIREVMTTLRLGRDVLVPVTAAGRGLEVLSLLLQKLAERGGDDYKVVFAAYQATELIAKARTLTEILLDDVILQEQQLFHSVVTCKDAESVTKVTGPKVCVVDGESLDSGIAAELLEVFLSRSSGGSGENLILLPGAPRNGSNAAALQQHTHGTAFSYSYWRRSRLSKVELEEHYVELEREQQRLEEALHEEGAYNVVREPKAAGDDDDEGDEADDRGDSAATGPKVPVATSIEQNTPGLTLPLYLSHKTKYLSFPNLEVMRSLNAAVVKGVDVRYGLPLTEQELSVIRAKAPQRVFSDEGPEALNLQNDAQAEANIPSKVMLSTQTVTLAARVMIADLSGLPDAFSVKQLLRGSFGFAKKVVPLRGTVSDAHRFAHFCRQEKSMKCGDNIYIPAGAGHPLELATHVFSYTIELHPTLAASLSNGLRQVKETRSGATWEVGWIHGELQRFGSSTASRKHVTKRRREDFVDVAERNDAHPPADGAVPLMMYPVSEALEQSCAEERDALGLTSGSVFVGQLELSRLREYSRSTTRHKSDFHNKAPMLVYDAGVCVRKGLTGAITVCSLASPAMFDVRNAVYAQFSQTL